MTMFCGLLVWTLVMAQAVDGLQCYSCFLCSEGDTSVTITCPPEKNACFIDETTNPIGKYVKECEANNGTGCDGLKCTCKTDLCNSALSSAKTDSNIGMTTASGRKSPATYQTSVPPVQNSLDNTFHSEVCPNGTYGYNCTLKCNCLNIGRCSYMEGRCEDGCASGWTGASCDIRDCTNNNGACDQNEICVSKASDVTSCQCKDGFNRSSAWLPCQPLLSVANSTNHSAIIGGVIGSFVALCFIVSIVILCIKYRKRLKQSNSTLDNEKANNTSTNPELYEIPATTNLTDENKYESLKVTKNHY